MKKVWLFLCLLFIFITPNFGGAQSGKSRPTVIDTLKTKDGKTVELRNDGTWSYVQSEEKVETGRLLIEAAIIYKVGGAQPLSRVNFHLLPESLETILSKAGLKNSEEYANLTLVSRFALGCRYPRTDGIFLLKARLALEKAVVSSMSTDFFGKGEFQNLKPGRYWITGYAETRGGFAFWDCPVEVGSGDTKVLIDQHNAAYAS